MLRKELRKRLLRKVWVTHNGSELSCRLASALRNKPTRELLGIGPLLGVLSELPCASTYTAERWHQKRILQIYGQFWSTDVAKLQSSIPVLQLQILNRWTNRWKPNLSKKGQESILIGTMFSTKSERWQQEVNTVALQPIATTVVRTVAEWEIPIGQTSWRNWISPHTPLSNKPEDHHLASSPMPM